MGMTPFDPSKGVPGYSVGPSIPVLLRAFFAGQQLKDRRKR